MLDCLKVFAFGDIPTLGPVELTGVYVGVYTNKEYMFQITKWSFLVSNYYSHIAQS